MARKNRRKKGPGQSPAKVGRMAAMETAGLAHLGAAAGGQVAKRVMFKDKNGKSRAHLVNYGAGAAGALILLSGKGGKNARRVAAVGLGMSAAQVAIKSYTEWEWGKKD